MRLRGHMFQRKLWEQREKWREREHEVSTVLTWDVINNGLWAADQSQSSHLACVRACVQSSERKVKKQNMVEEKEGQNSCDRRCPSSRWLTQQ